MKIPDPKFRSGETVRLRNSGNYRITERLYTESGWSYRLDIHTGYGALSLYSEKELTPITNHQSP